MIFCGAERIAQSEPTVLVSSEPCTLHRMIVSAITGQQRSNVIQSASRTPERVQYTNALSAIQFNAFNAQCRRCGILLLRQPKWGPYGELGALIELLAEKEPTGQLGCAPRSSHCNHSTGWNAAQQHIIYGITLW